MLPFITRYRNALQNQGLRHRIANVTHFCVIPLTQFRNCAELYLFPEPVTYSNGVVHCIRFLKYCLLSSPHSLFLSGVVNPWRACAARVTVLGL